MRSTRQLLSQLTQGVKKELQKEEIRTPAMISAVSGSILGARWMYEKMTGMDKMIKEMGSPPQNQEVPSNVIKLK